MPFAVETETPEMFREEVLGYSIGQINSPILTNKILKHKEIILRAKTKFATVSKLTLNKLYSALNIDCRQMNGCTQFTLIN